jgi:hypothetical protein
MTTSGGPNRFGLLLQAAEGPVGTRHYRIAIDAIALDERRTFIRLSYHYEVGLIGRLAMQAYLKTAGRSKIGFTEEMQSDGRVTPIGGLRGSLERNLMRYHLALMAYLEGAPAPAASRLDTRLRIWYRMSESYSRQLREQSLDEYLQAKAQEKQKQTATADDTGRRDDVRR